MMSWVILTDDVAINLQHIDVISHVPGRGLQFAIAGNGARVGIVAAVLTDTQFMEWLNERRTASQAATPAPHTGRG